MFEQMEGTIDTDEVDCPESATYSVSQHPPVFITPPAARPLRRSLPWVPLTIGVILLIGWGNLFLTWLALCNR